MRLKLGNGPHAQPQKGCKRHGFYFFDCGACNAVVWQQWPKQCGCGREHSAEAWETLHLVGEQTTDVETLEMRNCQCGSTIAVRTFVREGEAR
jgi:hypothetical protein